jgi:hypothetical protein
MFQFVDHRNGEVVHRDPPFAVYSRHRTACISPIAQPLIFWIVSSSPYVFVGKKVLDI